MLELSTIEKRIFSEAALSTYIPIIENTEKAINAISNDLDEILGLNDQKIKTQRHKKFNIDGTVPDDYSEKLLKIDLDNFIIAGIRHAGGNRNKPIVSIWPNFTIQSKNELEAISLIVEDSFSLFSPKFLEFWVNPNTEIAQILRDEISPAQQYIVGNVSEISQLPKPKHYEKIELKKVTDDYFNWYTEIYKDFHNEQPHLRYAFVEGKKVGLIAARARDLLGLNGVYFSELLLAKEYQGKGLAAALQRKFIDECLSKFEVVWGTIDFRNQPSTKTALRVGRRAIRSEFFLPL